MSRHDSETKRIQVTDCAFVRTPLLATDSIRPGLRLEPKARGTAKDAKDPARPSAATKSKAKAQGQKIAGRENGGRVLDESFFCPRCFASLPFNSLKNYAHRWRGNTTDKMPCRSTLHMFPSSVVLPRHPWATPVSYECSTTPQIETHSLDVKKVAHCRRKN